MPRIAALLTVLFLALLFPGTAAANGRVDPRLQPVLDLVGSTDFGVTVVARFEENGASLIYDDLPYGTSAQWDPNINAIVFDIDVQWERVEVLAFILVHEFAHMLEPWVNYGEECLQSEIGAEYLAVAWWISKYGTDGHPTRRTSR